MGIGSVVLVRAVTDERVRWGRVVGGGGAAAGAWPWQAALYRDGDFQCGATLVSAQWLLSASHCFYQYVYLCGFYYHLNYLLFCLCIKLSVFIYLCLIFNFCG